MEVVDPADVVDDRERRDVVEERVHREVAAERVLFRRAERVVAVHQALAFLRRAFVGPAASRVRHLAVADRIAGAARAPPARQRFELFLRDLTTEGRDFDRLRYRTARAQAGSGGR